MPVEDLMEHEVEEIRKGFKYFDRSGTGHIKTMDLGNALRWLKLVPTNKEIDIFIEMVDPNKCGRIKWDSFLYVVRQSWISEPQQREAKLWQAFLQFDKLDRGQMTVEELRTILLETGEEPLTEKEVNAIIKDVGVKDNLIEYGFLIRLWQK